MKPNAGWIRVGVGFAGAALAVSVFLPWSESGGAQATAWGLATGAAVLVLITGLVALAAAVTDGRVGVFRPDVSLRAAADLLAIVSTLVIIGVILFDIREGASPAYGAFIGLAAAAAVAAFSGDYSVVRGAPLFPSLKSGGK